MNADAWWNGLSEADKQRIYDLHNPTLAVSVTAEKPIIYTHSEPWQPWHPDRWKTEQNPNWWAHHYSEG